jgi:hypothetical protein
VGLGFLVGLGAFVGGGLVGVGDGVGVGGGVTTSATGTAEGTVVGRLGEPQATTKIAIKMVRTMDRRAKWCPLFSVADRATGTPWPRRTVRTMALAYALGQAQR